MKQLQKSQDFICAESKKMKNINESIAEKMYKNKAKDEEDNWNRAKETKEYAKEKAQMTRAMLRDVEQKKAKARKQTKQEGASLELTIPCSDEPEAEGEAEENEKDDDEEEAEAHAEVTRKPAAAVQKRPAACETNLAPEMGDFQYDFNREMQATDFAKSIAFHLISFYNPIANPLQIHCQSHCKSIPNPLQNPVPFI